MEIRKAIFGASRTGVLVVLLAVSGGRVLADQNDHTHQIGAKLKCMCGGCEQSAARCYHVGGAYSGPCGTAKTMLKEIDAHIASGKTDQQVLDAMIQVYGSAAYVEPPKSGFGLVAWVMPVLFLVTGLAVVLLVLKRWRKRPAAGAATPDAGKAEVAPELLARARLQAQRETED